MTSQSAITQARFAEDERIMPPAVVESSPLGMLVAAAGGLDIEKLRALMEMQKELLAMQARQAYTEAISAFKANPPRIVKDKLVDFQTSKGRTSYRHATLGNVCAAIIAGLAEHGISHRWDVDQASDKPNIKVTCYLTHKQGHFEKVEFSGPADDSGVKNRIQSIASAVTYLQRYTLLSITGLAAEDDDGRGNRTPGEVRQREESPPEDEPPPAHWSEFYPELWAEAEVDGKKLGDIDDADLGPLWRKYFTHREHGPKLHAWAADWIERAARKLPGFSLPANITECNPEQLWKLGTEIRAAKQKGAPRNEA